MAGVVEGAHMSHPDFRAGGKIFATLHVDNRHAMVKLTPEQQAQIIADHPAIFAPESGHGGARAVRGSS
ncbi:MAG TPA: MmcQ/YjbR family DNA-binding protein [Vicinamibacterales bacterium]|nr:MmcQ/YjbR family DNA-binding protein [Vicinamibacterales bacterium]